jgi:hypothetical protein
MLLVLFILFCVSIPVFAGDYLQSAHGDATYGANRSGMPAAYATGNCGHCHMQHGIGSQDGTSGTAYPYVIFNENFIEQSNDEYQAQDSICFRCHTASNSEQEGGAILNPDYAETFGGFDEGNDLGILEQYNPATIVGDSHHSLSEVRSYSANRFTWFRDDSTACVACHNPHLARRNKSDVDNTNLTPISLTSEHESLWGDDITETMNEYSGAGTGYQAPYHYISGYEPGGVSGGLGTSDPTKVPDYVTFCNECHDEAIYTSKLGRNLLEVDWTSNGDKHGMKSRNDITWLREPYLKELTPVEQKNNYVLNCTDCHEPHASPYLFLIRRSINGQPLNLDGVNVDMSADGRGFQCLQCHQDDSRRGTDGGNVNDWKEQHHSLGQDSPYSGRNNPGLKGAKLASCDCHGDFEGDDGQAGGADPIRCEICHYHGSYIPNPEGEWPANVPLKNGVLRKTF